MANYKPQRMARYRWLRERHFAPIEAREFSKLSRQYPALKVMVRSRSASWVAFNRKATNNEWSDFKRAVEWRETLKKFYSEGRYKAKRDPKTKEIQVSLQNWLAHKDKHGKPTPPKPSPWEWYDAVFQRLPDELKWDTPRSHRRRTVDPDLKLDKVMRQKWIAELRETARREPERRAELAKQARRLGGRL